MYGTVNGPNLDKDSSQIVVCPEREAAACSCVSVSLVNADVVGATSGELARQSRHKSSENGGCGGTVGFSYC